MVVFYDYHADFKSAASKSLKVRLEAAKCLASAHCVIMPERQASVVICDEVLVSLTGKSNIIGMYKADIAILVEKASSPQLVFVFQIERE